MDNIEDDDNMWTGWLDGDTNGFVGDFETIWDYQNAMRGYDASPGDGQNPTCHLWCQRPLKVKWRLSPNNHFTDPPSEVEQCVVLKKEKFRTNTLVGFECINSNQMESTCSKEFCAANSMLSSAMPMAAYKREIKCDHCPNFEVNYLCPPSEPRPADTEVACPWQKRALRLRELKWQHIDSARTLKNTEREVEQLDQEELRKKAEKIQKADSQLDTKSNELRSLLKLLLDQSKH
jgi:hypothetical protein